VTFCAKNKKPKPLTVSATGSALQLKQQLAEYHLAGPLLLHRRRRQ
jgi:hypothetical protein